MIKAHVGNSVRSRSASRNERKNLVTEEIYRLVASSSNLQIDGIPLAICLIVGERMVTKSRLGKVKRISSRSDILA